MSQSRPSVSIVGLGKLGFGLALAYASKGFQVVGIDINQSVLNSVEKGVSPIVESDATETLKKFKRNFYVTAEHREAIKKTDTTFILVATPSDKKNNFSNKYVENAAHSLGVALKSSKKKYHLFVISSTVMPGSVEEKIIPLLEEASGRKLNKGFGVCYIPDFVALGNVVADFLNPDFVLIGESDKKAGNLAHKMYAQMVKNNTPIHHMSILNAEIAKVALNCYVTVKITFANLLGNICESVPGGDADLVTQAIGTDRRIGTRYFKSGLSFGGTCFPRDTKAFIAFANKVGADVKMIRAVDAVNSIQDDRLFDLVSNSIKQNKAKGVSIFGLAFKPGTPVIEESPSIKLIERILQKHPKVKITVHDTLASKATEEIFGNEVSYAQTIKQCAEASQVWVVTTPDKTYRSIKPSMVQGKITLVDCWRLLRDRFENVPRVTYQAVGIGNGERYN